MFSIEHKRILLLHKLLPLHNKYENCVIFFTMKVITEHSINSELIEYSTVSHLAARVVTLWFRSCICFLHPRPLKTWPLELCSHVVIESRASLIIRAEVKR